MDPKINNLEFVSAFLVSIPDRLIHDHYPYDLGSSVQGLAYGHILIPKSYSSEIRLIRTVFYVFFLLFGFGDDHIVWEWVLIGYAKSRSFK